MSTHTLVRHRDIRSWVSARRGQPAIARVPDRMGTMRSKLSLSFARKQDAPTETPTLDDGMSPVSWNAWLAELAGHLDDDEWERLRAAAPVLEKLAHS